MIKRRGISLGGKVRSLILGIVYCFFVFGRFKGLEIFGFVSIVFY